MYATFFAYVNSAYFFQCIVDYWVFASASQLMTIIVKASAQLNRGRQQCRRCVGVDIAVADVAVAVVAVADVAVAVAGAYVAVGYSCCWPVSAPVPVLVCGAYLGLLQHAIYKCAWDRLCRLVAGSNAGSPYPGIPVS